MKYREWERRKEVRLGFILMNTALFLTSWYYILDGFLEDRMDSLWPLFWVYVGGNALVVIGFVILWVVDYLKWNRTTCSRCLASARKSKR